MQNNIIEIPFSIDATDIRKGCISLQSRRYQNRTMYYCTNIRCFKKIKEIHASPEYHILTGCCMKFFERRK
ncbi:MAG: hypothetical protein ACFFHD_15275 [Promethearchaeota archaeon]